MNYKSSGFAELDRRCHSGSSMLRQIFYTNLRKANLCCQMFRNIGSFLKIVANLSDKEYGDNEFSYREVYFMNDFDEYVDEDNIDDVLHKADE